MTASPTTIPAALLAVTETRADGVAIRDENRSLTYAELERTTNHVATEFCKRTSLGAPIAIIAEHRAHAAINLLAAAKAGRIAVLIDTREPPNRVAQLYQAAGCEMLVAADAIPGLDVPVVHPADLDGTLDDLPPAQVSGDDVAAVYYTSGSTGAPKGVALTHNQIVQRTRYRVERGGFRADDVYAVVVNLAFGYSTGLYVALFSGCVARLLDISTLGVVSTGARLRDESISVFACVPTVLRAITDAVLADGRSIESVRMVEVGGEALNGKDAEAFFAAFPRAEIRNLYGSAETGTIAQDIQRFNHPRPSGPLRVMEVLDWQTVELLSEDGMPVPPGEQGEVVVSGPGVALGYWRDEALTAEWFSDAPDGARRARTGDMGRYTHDGLLALEGRRDDQVKVRGQRVDLTLVARALTALSDVEDAVAISDEGGELVAYVVPAEGQRLVVRDLRATLGEQLPGYMVPTEFLVLDAIPRTDRGKLDRAQLRVIRADAAARRAPYVAPKSDMEQRIAHEFESMLGVVDVGLDDSFHDLGGDSLGVLELLEMISDEYSIDLHEYLLLESTVHSVATVRALTNAIESTKSRMNRYTPVTDPAEDAVLLRPDGVAVLRIGTHRDDGRALYLVPGAGEGTVRFLPLAKELRRCNAYTFHRRGFQTRDRPDRTVEQIAARIVSAMQSLQPSGPYLVGGFSFGARVAYEVAQQLRAQEAHVGMLLLIDPLEPTGQRRRGPFRRIWSRLVRFLFGKPSTSRVARAHELVDQASQSNAKYRPRPYDGFTLVVESTAEVDPDTPRWVPSLTGPTEVLVLDGEHLGVMVGANAKALASRIDALANS